MDYKKYESDSDDDQMHEISDRNVSEGFNI
jgi:hypothetical protein